MKNASEISQIEWEDYVQCRDRESFICSLPEVSMTKKLWNEFHQCRKRLEEIYQRYESEGLKARYQKSLSRLDE